MQPSNRVKILDAIRQGRNSITRKELAETTGLAWGTMYKTVEALTAANLVFTRHGKASAPGRPGVPLCLNAGERLFAGLDVGSETSKLIFTDLEFRPLYEDRIPTEPYSGPERFIAWLTDWFNASREKAGFGVERFGGIGLAISGVVDSEAGLLLSGGNFGMKRCAGLPLESFATAVGLPVFAVTTQTAAVAAEYHFGRRRHCANLVTVGLGVGIGSGAIANHHLLISHPDRPVGYIGHLHIPGNSYRCRCGFTGCIEACSGARNLAGIAAAELPGRPELHSAEKLDAAAAAGDSDARRLLDRAALYNASGIAAMIQLYSPEALIFSGGQCRSEGYLYNRTLIELRGILPEERRRTITELTVLGVRQSALGAARLAYERFI